MTRFGIIGIAFCALAAVAPAHAADVATAYKKAPAYAPSHDWSGLYFGVNAGYGWSTFKGALGGGQLGYNLQAGKFVLGVETDLQASGIKSTQTLTDGGDTLTETHKLTWFGTTRARLGVVMDDTMPYITGGLAYGQRKGSGTATGTVTGTYTTQATKTGWTAGAGVESAISKNLSWKLEYLYISLPGYTSSVELGGGGLEIEYNKMNVSVARLGLNYRF